MHKLSAIPEIDRFWEVFTKNDQNCEFKHISK
jgi:hypothetical protein